MMEFKSQFNERTWEYFVRSLPAAIEFSGQMAKAQRIIDSDERQRTRARKAAISENSVLPQMPVSART